MNKPRQSVSWRIWAFRIISVVLFAYALITLILASFFSFKGFVDFPCFADISQDGCLASGGYGDIGDVKIYHIQVYLTSVQAGFSGGGCWHEASDTDQVSAAGHVFKREGENLVIDGKTTLKPGEAWNTSGVVSFWNPWQLIKSHTWVKNRGMVDCIQSSRTKERFPYGPTLVAIGGTGTSYETNWIGIFAVIAWLVAVVVVEWRFKARLKTRLRSDRA